MDGKGKYRQSLMSVGRAVHGLARGHNGDAGYVYAFTDNLLY